MSKINDFDKNQEKRKRKQKYKEKTNKSHEDEKYIGENEENS